MGKIQVGEAQEMIEKVSYAINLAFGMFLTLDGFLLHRITFHYGFLARLDPYFSHAFWGLFLMLIGVAGFLRGRRGERK